MIIASAAIGSMPIAPIPNKTKIISKIQNYNLLPKTAKITFKFNFNINIILIK